MRTDEEIEEMLNKLKVGLKVTWCYSGPNGKMFWRKGTIQKLNKINAKVLMHQDKNRGVYPEKIMTVNKRSLKQ